MSNTQTASHVKTPTTRTTHTTYLVHKTHLKQRALTLRIPQHVHEALNATRERADKAGFVFDIQAVVLEALERAVSKVSSELGALEGGEPGVDKMEAPRRNRRPAPAKEA
jgi:hypothetical protein